MLGRRVGSDTALQSAFLVFETRAHFLQAYVGSVVNDTKRSMRLAMSFSFHLQNVFILATRR